MEKMNTTLLERILNLGNNLHKAELDIMTAMKFSDYYDSFATPFIVFVTPYIWILPLIVIIVVFVTFKRAKLFGVTQKLLFAALVIDMIFVLTTGMRDGLLNWLDMGYGFIEYEICGPFIFSFRLQGVLHNSSILVKTFLSMRTVLLFAFPIQVRLFKLKKWAAITTLVHIVCCTYFLYSPILLQLSPVNTVQEFKKGRPLKIIRACVFNNDMDALNFIDTSITSVAHFIYFIIAIIIPCVNTIILSILTRKQMKAVSILTTYDTKSVKYLHLMKVSIMLGVSFVVQEIPQVIFQALMFESDSQLSRKYNSLSIIAITLSFAIGKPVDLLIYSMQSQAFRSQLAKLKCRIRKH